MKVNEVVTVVTVGGEFIGKFQSEDADQVTLSDPHLVTPNGEQIGFLPTVSLTGKQPVTSVSFNKTAVICMVETQEDVAKSYRSSLTGLVLPS